MVAEVTTCQANVAKRQGALDSGAQQLAQSRNAIDQLAQEYAAAVSDAEMCDALVQRELREAQVRIPHQAALLPPWGIASFMAGHNLEHGAALVKIQDKINRRWGSCPIATSALTGPERPAKACCCFCFLGFPSFVRIHRNIGCDKCSTAWLLST